MACPPQFQVKLNKFLIWREFKLCKQLGQLWKVEDFKFAFNEIKLGEKSLKFKQSSQKIKHDQHAYNGSLDSNYIKSDVILKNRIH